MQKQSCVIAFVAAAALAATQAPAQPAAGNQESRLEQLERRFNQLESKYQNDLYTRDATIESLKSEVTRLKAKDPQSIQQRQEHDKALSDLLKEIDTGESKEATERQPVSFNPDIAVVADFFGSYSSDTNNKALNRFDVREVELDLRAAVDPRADAVVILSVARDADNPVFDPEQAEGPDTSISPEEAYLFLHDFGVPNLTAKLGRFHLRFGRQNILHAHDLPTADPPYVNQSFLAPEALSDAGASFSYLVPNPWDQYIEVVGEVIAGEGGATESPTLDGDLSVTSPAFNTHVLWNTDVAEAWNLEVGGSYLHGSHDVSAGPHTDPFGDVDILGADVTLVRTDPTGGFNNFLLQGEAMYGTVDQPGGDVGRAWGAYVLAQQQLHKDWYIGTRLDWTQNANDGDQEVWAVSPYVSWYWSEFLRFRVEYQHKDGDLERSADMLFFQITWIFGAHPPHPYWAMR